MLKYYFEILLFYMIITTILLMAVWRTGIVADLSPAVHRSGHRIAILRK